MPDFDRTLGMVRQMRWREAHRAKGGAKDSATDQLIQAHATILAIEAAKLDGPPEAVWNVDIDGYPLGIDHASNQSKGRPTTAWPPEPPRS